MSLITSSTLLVGARPRVVIDTSVWVSRLITQDSNHAAAVAWVNQYLLGGGLFIAPILFITETAAAVSRITGFPARGRLAAARLYSTVEMNLVQIDQALVDEATDLAANLKLRVADAYFVAVAKKLALPLVTFDKEQLARGTPTVATVRP